VDPFGLLATRAEVEAACKNTPNLDICAIELGEVAFYDEIQKVSFSLELAMNRETWSCEPLAKISRVSCRGLKLIAHPLKP